jgi:hypothetical protein
MRKHNSRVLKIAVLAVLLCSALALLIVFTREPSTSQPASEKNDAAITESQSNLAEKDQQTEPPQPAKQGEAKTNSSSHIKLKKSDLPDAKLNKTKNEYVAFSADAGAPHVDFRVLSAFKCKKSVRTKHPLILYVDREGHVVEAMDVSAPGSTYVPPEVHSCSFKPYLKDNKPTAFTTVLPKSP